jgi:DNA invertase Pin-like site-specific DNA recombinase
MSFRAFTVARVSTLDQNPALQLERLREAGCARIITEKASGARADRPELTRLLRDMLRDGDTLVVWKLDRLARSLKQLIETAEA